MNLQKLRKKQAHHEGLSCLAIVVMVATIFYMPESSLADELGDCMTGMMQQAEDSMTIGDLRLECEKRIQDSSYTTLQGEKKSVVSERASQDEAHVLQPFTLMSHKPNYILLGANNTAGYKPDVYQEQFNDSSIKIDSTEAQFQISIKSPLAVNLFDVMDIYAAYTNRSFWQVYNDNSAPFRETNHEPEAWLQFHTKWEFLGFTNSVNTFGIVHQSNGRGGTLSRSWNRIYANFIAERGDFAISIKPWYRITEDAEDDDNPDITDYLGHYEIRAAYKWNDHVFSAMSRNNLESGFEKGAVELSWSFPLGEYPYLKGYIHYFTGYGESLIDYDNYVNTVGIGVSLSDWL